MDKQQSGDSAEHNEHSPEAWRIPCDSRKRDGRGREHGEALPVSKERHRACEDRCIGNEHSLPCITHYMGDSRDSGTCSRLCCPMEQVGSLPEFLEGAV